MRRSEEDRWEKEDRVPICCVCDNEVTNYHQAMIYHMKCWHQEEDERGHRIKELIRENPENYDRSLDTAFLFLEEFTRVIGNDMGAVWEWTTSARLEQLREEMQPLTSNTAAKDRASEPGR